MSELYLIRHGESEMNTNAHLVGGRSNETPLTQRGVRQAQLLGSYLLEQGIIPTDVFASPAIRTMDTARHTLAAMGLDIEPTIAYEIQEMDQGDYVGRPRLEVYTPEVLAEIKRQGKDFKLEGGESMNGVGQRMYDWVEQTVSTEDGRRTVVFGHGLAIRTLVSMLHDWSHAETLASETGNTSITTLDYRDAAWGLRDLGTTPHLS